MTDLGPTREARQHDVYEAPEQSQTKSRRAYRRLPMWEQEHRNGTLTDEQARAAETLHRYWHGAQGADVRTETGGISYDPDYPAQEHYASQLRHAQRYCNDPAIWNLCERFAIMEVPLVTLGRQEGCPHHSNAMLRMFAAGRLTRGLDLIAQAWGIAQHARSRERKAA